MPVVKDTTVFWENEKNALSKRVKATEVFRYSRTTRLHKPTRAVNLEFGEVVSTHITATSQSKVVERNIKLETECGYILECSVDTLIYMMDGWKRADEIEVGMDLKVNGQPSDAYMDREWLYEWYITRKKTQKEIAEMCSTPDHPVSERTIRRWVKKFGIEKTKPKGVCGAANPKYKGDTVSRKGLYERARTAIEKPDRCDMCGYVGKNIDYHHKDHDLLNWSPENLIAICERCHMAEHRGAIIKHVRFTKISKVERTGFDDVIGIQTECGNYVAAGFIIKGEEGK